MECRSNCGACCIAPSINQPFYGMPNGKAAGVACVHLAEDFLCKIFKDPRRPKVCGDFKPEPEFCGNTRLEAIEILSLIETQTASG